MKGPLPNKSIKMAWCFELKFTLRSLSGISSEYKGNSSILTVKNTGESLNHERIHTLTSFGRYHSNEWRYQETHLSSTSGVTQRNPSPTPSLIQIGHHFSPALKKIMKLSIHINLHLVYIIYYINSIGIVVVMLQKQHT